MNWRQMTANLKKTYSVFSANQKKLQNKMTALHTTDMKFCTAVIKFHSPQTKFQTVHTKLRTNNTILRIQTENYTLLY